MSTRRFSKSTITDVAAQARVSKTTVSLFVNGRANACSAETAERIQAAIADLHYAPSRATRGLRQRATRIIGACLASPIDMRNDVHRDLRKSRVERLWYGLVEAADQADYALLHYPASTRAAASCDWFLDGSVDGLLFSTNRKDERPRMTAAAGMPTVNLDHLLAHPTGCGAAYANEADTVALALSHLWGLGHRRIAHLAGPVAPTDNVSSDYGQSDIAIAREQNTIAWLHAHDASDPVLRFANHAWVPDHAAEAVAHWRALADPPTAAFCANDALALGVIRAVQALGGRVPEDLSIVGVDNIGATSESDPPLTTVDIPAEEVGRAAMRALLLLMDGAPAEACRLVVPVTQLVVRASTAPPKHQP